jgi:23S rRNA pseudouridine1911/1915/1917 synthase
VSFGHGENPNFTFITVLRSMAAKIDILYEDNHLLIINKPAGLPSQGDKTEDPSAIDLAAEYIKQEYNKPGNVYVGLAHRIDRPTSGALILCKTSKSLSRMGELFKKREIQKCYLALVQGHTTEQYFHLQDYLYKDKQKNISRVVTSKHKDSKLAELDGEALSYINGRTLLKIYPHTGRSHQIRVQLSNFGLPIVGDVKYGGPRHNDSRAISLHSHSLSFLHPVTKKPLVVESWPIWGV